MKLIVVLAVLVAFTKGGIVKRNANCGVTSLIDEGDAGNVRAAHNRFRREEKDGADIVRMKYDDGLARRAQEWANQCTWDHGMLTDCDGKTIGQNMYMSGGGDTIPDTYNVTYMIKRWNDEKADYHYTTTSCNPGKVCGHYTQVVWGKTERVGCGIAKCASVTGSTMKNAVVFVCNYSPAGNYDKTHPYKSGITCSACNLVVSGSGYYCDHGLCHPCTPKLQGSKCTCETKVCQNGGTFDADNCVCKCSPKFFGELCDRECACNDAAGYETACSQWTAYCTEAMYATFMKSTCPATCNMCELPAECNTKK